MKAGNMPENIKVSYSTAVITTLDEIVALQAVNLHRQQDVKLGLKATKSTDRVKQSYSVHV